MKNNPLEDTQNKFFNLLAAAVKNREYKTIDYEYDDIVTYQDAKCLKLIFTDNNWYLACEIKDERLILLRVAFIKKLQYCPNKPSSYQTIALKKYNSYFENMQNAMTLADTASQKAILQANKHIARYFKKEMKPFFISQRFIGESPDGGIIFSVNFTQSLEVLPFIKRWLPDLEIIEPRSLKEALKLDLQKALSVIDSS
ncbi:MAG: WYL domain-containing protein [Helicobacteraceae bacterium]|nr:WYL domain-containing protein [Helicobacteraceae bacterium]